MMEGHRGRRTMGRDLTMQLRTRIEGGGTRLLDARAEGLTVYDPDVSMIGNGGGAVHCMCQALRRDRVRAT